MRHAVRCYLRYSLSFRDVEELLLHRVGGCGMVTNDCAVVLKETRTAALLLELPKQMTEHYGFGQHGREVTSSPVIALRFLGSC